MSDKELITSLKSKFIQNNLEIEKLQQSSNLLKRVIENLEGVPVQGIQVPGIEEYPEKEPKISVIRNTKKKEKLLNPVKNTEGKKANKYYTPRPKNQPSGTMKFCDYLLKIFSSKPDKKLTSKDASVIMGKAISENKIYPVPTKELASNTSAYLWYYLQRGKLIKEEVEGGKDLYQYSENVLERKSDKKIKPVKKTESITLTEGSGNLEEKILEIIRKEKKISLPNLVLKIQRSKDYLEISKNLTGTLAKCAEDILRDFTAREILEWNDNNEYCIDKAGDL